MGWFRKDRPRHEGFVAGSVQREGLRPGSSLYDVEAVQAACECGWRSPYYRVRSRGEFRRRFATRRTVDFFA